MLEKQIIQHMTSVEFEQSKADPCVLRKVAHGEVEMVMTVHVNDILGHTKDQATMERFAPELGRKSKLKDMGDGQYYMGTTSQGAAKCVNRSSINTYT